LRLTQIEAERDDRAAVAEAARVELVSAQAQAGERDAAAANEIEILRREIAELTLVAARAGEEAKARLTNVEALRNYVGRLRGALAEARHATGERAVEAEALRGALAEAQQGAADAEVLRRELGELRDALAVAREVGQAVMKTLAADGQARVPPDEAIGWWRALKRRFGRSGIA
jgi:chromosome segregation ATPase